MMPPSNGPPKQVGVRESSINISREVQLPSSDKEAQLFYPVLMTVVAGLVLMVYKLLSTYQSPSVISIPTIWSKGFGPDVKWEFDHGVEHVQTKRPLVIAHRGHSGAMPEETLEAYLLAVSSGADIIECDACLTKDLEVICVHESWINKTTNAAEVFSIDRSSEYFVPDRTGGKVIHDFFTVDFTLDELKMLTKLEPRLYRNQNNNRLYRIATLEEMIMVAKSAKHPVGIHVEIKDPVFVNNVSKGLMRNNKRFEDVVIEVLHRNGYERKTSPCFIQCFDENSLKYISSITSLPLILLIEFPGNVSEEHLEGVAQYAYGIGPDKKHLTLINTTTRLIESHSNLVDVSHKFGLRLHIYTFRNEHEFLAWNYRQDPYNEYADFFRLGIDGYFTDFPDTLKNFLEVIYARRSESSMTSVLKCSLWTLYLSLLINNNLYVFV